MDEDVRVLCIHDAARRDGASHQFGRVAAASAELRHTHSRTKMQEYECLHRLAARVESTVLWRPVSCVDNLLRSCALVVRRRLLLRSGTGE